MRSVIKTRLVKEFPMVRCSQCDRESDHIVTFVSPSNDIINVCWSCQTRSDKGFNTKAEFSRTRRPLRHGR